MFNRRDFLVTALSASAATCFAGQSPSTARLRFAPETGLFEGAGCESVAAQIEVAAKHGFSDFCDADLLRREATEIHDIRRMADQCHVSLGPVRGPSLSPSAIGLAHWQDATRNMVLRMPSAGISTVRILAAPGTSFLTDPSRRGEIWQQAILSVADVALTYGAKLVVEPWQHPGHGIETLVRWADRVAGWNHPGVQLSVDTYVWAAAGGDFRDVLHRHPHVCGHVALADFPGGLEAGTGELPLVAGMHQLLQTGYAGVIALRHGKSVPGVAGNQAVVAACHALQAAVVQPRSSKLV